jgi:hypothetical protein
MKYCVYDENGQILRTGHCGTEEMAMAQDPVHGRVLIVDDSATDDGHYVHEGAVVAMPDKPKAPHHTFNHKSKKWEDQRTPEQIALAYQNDRLREYPAIADQLDAIWKWIADPINTDTADMVKRIQAVKSAHPKPV